jgi:LysM repeat protein
LPRLIIKSNLQFLISGLSILAFVATALPNQANAFWPFSANADAAAISVSAMPGSGTPALRAAINSNPNPNKGLVDNVQTSGGKALLAYSGPSGTIADVAGSNTSGRISVYVVRRGDTLSDIAEMFNVSINTIIWSNNLSNSRDVRPGDTLIILPISGIEHKIVKGDTIKSLAKKYSADADEISQYNGLDSADSLEIGSIIIIPGGEILAPAPTPASRPVVSPIRVGGGVFLAGYFGNPLPSGIITQGIHGWNGIDIGAARGTPIYAAADGAIIISRTNGGWNGGYGNYIVITHENGTQTLYSHLKSAIVSPGQPVMRGQIIGYVGSTGRATGPHLHFEVRGAVNPFLNCALNSVCSPK